MFIEANDLKGERKEKEKKRYLESNLLVRNNIRKTHEMYSIKLVTTVGITRT